MELLLTTPTDFLKDNVYVLCDGKKNVEQINVKKCPSFISMIFYSLREV